MRIGPSKRMAKELIGKIAVDPTPSTNRSLQSFWSEFLDQFPNKCAEVLVVRREHFLPSEDAHCHLARPWHDSVNSDSTAIIEALNLID